MASNYRAACRARSRAEFVAKLGTVNEESDYWLEYITKSRNHQSSVNVHLSPAVQSRHG
jgi:hypothetical protein